MGFFARSWLDRFLGRRRRGPADADAVTARAREEQDAAPEASGPSTVEEGAAAARDEVLQHERMPPPATG